MSHNIAKNSVAFHLSINVSDIDRTVAFFSQVFGTSPTKHRRDYAKFELLNPPLTLSFEPISPVDHGTMNHVGFKFSSTEELVEFQRRLESAGLQCEREEGVECCYAKQTKFWLHDPDGTLWEMYVLEGDIEHRGAGQSETALTGKEVSTDSQSRSARLTCETIASKPIEDQKQTWTHRLGTPFSIPGHFGAGSLDEVMLQGTFNGEGTASEVEAFLLQVSDQLKPGGRVSIHCLTADRHLDAVPTLPGPASVVKAIPELESLVADLERTGFSAVRLTKYGSRACFTVEGVELRETMIEAIKPMPVTDQRVAVTYRGPFAEIKLDDGSILRRGRRSLLPAAVIEQMQSTEIADSLVVLEEVIAPVACSS